MELAFAAPTGVSRFWGVSRKAPAEHVIGRRALSDDELKMFGGGDDGGDCGAGGDCGDSGGSCGDSGCAPADPSAISMPGVTVIGIAPTPAGFSISDAAALGSLFGGAAAVVGFAVGLTGTMSLGTAIALGSLFGGIIGVVAVGVVFAGIALANLISNFMAVQAGNVAVGSVDWGGGNGGDGP